MDTLLEILKKTESYFASKGLESPRLDAELILGASLGLKRLDLYLQHDRMLFPEQLGPLREMVRRRGQREPWQYIVGEVEFAGVRLKTDHRALIPRPETEELVEILGAREPHPQSILDLGCGTGALGLALAKCFPDSRVTLVDVSKEALQLAEENTRRNDLSDRVTLIQSDWFTQVTGTFDWIVSNPPYLTEQEWQTAEPEVREFEPQNALVGGEQGLDPYKVIFDQGIHYLNAQGLIALETGTDMHPELFRLAGELHWKDSQSLQDLHQRSRFFLATRPE